MVAAHLGHHLEDGTNEVRALLFELLQVVFVDYMQSSFLKVFTNEINQVGSERKQLLGGKCVDCSSTL